MKKYFTLFTLVACFNLSAQFLEFGANLGATSYAGDLKRGYNLTDASFAISPAIRFNFSEIFTLKLSILAGTIKGSEEPIDALGIVRNHSFSSGILEASASFEYHFLDYKTENPRFHYSPYVFAGFGLINYDNAPGEENISPFQPVMPLGGGIKYLFNRKYVIGMEIGARRTFFDYIDGISGGDQLFKQEYNFGNPNDDDWFFFTSISFSIIIHDIPCPFPYSPNKSIISR